jgi:hypothetical protein
MHACTYSYRYSYVPYTVQLLRLFANVRRHIAVGLRGLAQVMCDGWVNRETTVENTKIDVIYEYEYVRIQYPTHTEHYGQEYWV